MHRANTFKAKGMVLKGVSMSKVRARHEPKLGIIVISVKGVKLSKAMGSIGRGTQQGSKTERFWFNMGKDIKRMSRNNVREARDYSNAVPSIRSLEEGIGIRRGGRRKSRGGFRM